ncbi:glycosyl transferase, group 1 [Acidothermus cellulolyticus 11B]|uniref:Glycosyl transferase, group 1 n=1 Tax=Acidothermus cellulolyticus (strain ATCC 43068 / DSM 8971 / 11B) TaxID=351607 RepID=A0LRY3_ACIC1|nr:glycosyltransferase family 1 protein [Acidothermus cellulolyticus]ABK52193.1 glycosyl transferase, group 1 [Acidothermus cellulolyticus 11B]
MPSVHVTLDATPLLGIRTGVGHYVAQLAAALAARDDVRLTLTAFTWRGRLNRLPDLPPGAAVRARRAPARALRLAWRLSNLPPVERICGRADVFHGTNFVLPPARSAAGVVTIHDLAFLLYPDTVDAKSREYRVLVPRALQRARVVVVPSRAIADDLTAAYGFPRDRVVVTPLGVDAAWFTATPPGRELRERYRIPARYVLFIGTLEPRKNLPVLLQAHRLARAGNPQVPPLVVVGAAGWGDVPVDTADDGSVVRTGYLPHDVVRSLTAGAAAVVIPSRYEGFGLPALEAFACGTPVVASDIPALREVTGGLARYVPVSDAEALAEALCAISDDAADDAGRSARRTWAATFTWDRCADLTVAAYRQACAG